MFDEIGKIEVEVGQCEARILLALIFNFFDESGAERSSQLGTIVNIYQPQSTDHKTDFPQPAIHNCK